MQKGFRVLGAPSPRPRCAWAGEEGVFGKPSLAAVSNWIQLPFTLHKGPIEGGGEAAPRQHQLPPLFTAPQKPLEPPLRQEGAEPASAARRQKKQPVQAAMGGLPGLVPSCSRTATGTPRTFPRASAMSSQMPPSISPGGDARVASPELSAPGAARSRAAARPQLPASPGRDKGAFLQGWHSRGRCHQRPGSRTVPNPAALQSLVPSSPGGPPAVPRARGCASFALAPCREATRDAAA